ncbi:hypothetical protein AJ79_01081 [Helicocarpus griseus UAMH5409]|uniref:GPI anchored protein n=1 Tax=Helicocarpus griseus UAMH5409 TaxID=1447875 RepID=A0A2B7Y8U5_9EURO|nr:hypothetical protein AJ79_01081 [Helicocarpus griseus UAMH5409]
MRFIPLALFALSASVSALESGQVAPDFPEILEGTRDILEKASKNASSVSAAGGLKALMKRACPAQCTQFCCVSDGTCIPSRDWSCCGGGVTCGPGRKCCHNGCIDENEECCQTPGRHCDAGLECWKINGRPRCCKPGECGSSTISRTRTSTDRATRTTTSSGSEATYYTWTITWTYWTVIARITSTRTTTEIVSFYGTNSADASSSLRSYTATATFSPPGSGSRPSSTSAPTGGSSGGGNNLFGVPGDNGGQGAAAIQTPGGMWSWHSALIAGAAIVPGLFAVYL